MDMRGFGASSWSPTRDYKLETLSADAVAVMDALGWRQAVLLGHSFGGRIALATAGWKPERAAAVVLVDFAPDIAPAGPPPYGGADRPASPTCLPRSTRPSRTMATRTFRRTRACALATRRSWNAPTAAGA